METKKILIVVQHSEKPVLIYGVFDSVQELELKLKKDFLQYSFSNGHTVTSIEKHIKDEFFFRIDVRVFGNNFSLNAQTVYLNESAK